MATLDPLSLSLTAVASATDAKPVTTYSTVTPVANTRRRDVENSTADVMRTSSAVTADMTEAIAVLNASVLALNSCSVTPVKVADPEKS
eukprot:1339613-Rhodomonas_salina.2